MNIHVLTEEMASRIAAGEVVERPAAVVKELVENSLDAGATEIFVSLEKSGTSLVQVTDNGEGMPPEDLALSVERYATSKLKQDEDLFRIATLGFRGEALPSIASVSKLAICSRQPSATSGYGLSVTGGKKGQIHPAAASFGTTIEVRDLFFNTPARRKFLKSPPTELSHVCDVVNRTALAHPNVHFRLQHDGRTIADYVAVSGSKDRLVQVFGGGMAKDLAPFQWSGQELSVHGYLSSAPISFPNSRYLYTFVNRRYVRDKVLTHALLHGYETLLMKGQYPAVILFVDMPFAEVDVNVHPAKYEVRFRRQGDVHEAVSRAIRQALQREAKAPMLRMSPIPSAPSAVSESALSYASPPFGRVESLAHRENIFVMPPATQSMQAGFFSALNVLGQILGCYLVCSSSHGLVLIDQHAAHERIAFEKLRRQMDDGKVATQSLLIPQRVDLSGGEMMLLEQKLTVLASFGFSLEAFGPTSYAIMAVPALLPAGDHTQLVRQMVVELAEVETSAKLRRHLEDRLATIACHSVIRANRALETDEMRALLRELDEIEFATQCPHGRPVLIEISRDDLERMFKRVV